MGFDGFWYRCEIRHFSVGDEDGDHLYTTAQVRWRKFRVIKETPKGVKLAETGLGATDPDKWRGEPDPRFVTGPHQVFGNSLRQLACPTKELAWADAIARKERHIAGCQARLRRAEGDLLKLRMGEPA